MTAAGIDLGAFRRTTPFEPMWPNRRGRPVDRHYVEGFLDRHRTDIRGTVLEMASPGYTRAFGGDRVERSDVLDVVAANGDATIVADLAVGEGIPTERFDCFILTQTLFLIHDLAGCVRTVHRILRPGGVALVTVPGITHISRADYEECGQHWGFTPHGMRTLFEAAFPPPAITVESHGNVLSATAFLFGLSLGELSTAELDDHDPDYPLIITIRAVKPTDMEDGR